MSQITSYSWDEENRMVGVLNPDGSSEAFTYAGDGQRRSKSTYTSSSALSDLINYVWDGENVLQEVDGTTGETKAHYTDYPGYWGGLTSLRTDASTPASSGAQFNASAFGSAQFNQASSGGSTPQEQSFFYLFDQQSSTRQLLNEDADASDGYTYRAFGEEEENTGSTRNPHRFQGEVGPYTEAEDRAWIRAREYDTLRGVWCCKDPIRFDGMDWNLYRFVYNDPVRNIDPSGLAVPAVAFVGACVPLGACGVSLSGCYPCGTDSSCWQKCISDTVRDLQGTFAGEFCWNALDVCLCAIGRGRGGGGKSGAGRGGKGKPRPPKKPKKCPPCKPPVGTLGCRTDRNPTRPHQGYMGPHVQYYQMHQSPKEKGCRCFWHNLKQWDTLANKKPCWEMGRVGGR